MSEETKGLSWDERLALDPFFWIAAEVSSQEELISSGARDFAELFPSPPTPEDRGSALDLGCGVGRLLLPATKIFKKLHGVDASPRALESARGLLKETPDLTLTVVTSGEELPEVIVDVVYSFATLPHLSPRKLLGYLTAVHRILRTDGSAKLQLYVGNEVLFHEADTFSIRSYDRSRLGKTLEMIGFSQISLRPLKLPFDGTDHELIREPVIVEMRKEGSSRPRDIEALCAELCQGREGADGVPSRDEYRMLVTRANTLIREQKLREAEPFITRAVSLYPDEASVAALAFLRQSLELLD